MDAPKIMSLHLLKEITRDFSHEQELGSGKYGTVYKGLQNGVETAVKMLHLTPGVDDCEQFKREFENLRRLRHRNIVQLLGYCYEIKREYVDPGDGRYVFADRIYRALSFEYMHSGNLQEYISEEFNGLDWQTRYKIIKGICEGLKYLHEEVEVPIYHLDLKPENILLDKNMTPKLADFGLSRLVGNEQTGDTESPVGTIGYLPPEYIEENLISKKFDIFSLGVVIIKIMAGHGGYNKKAEMQSQKFIDLVHDNWRNRLLLQATPGSTSFEGACSQVKRCIEIASDCVRTDRKQRPEIGTIIHWLNETEYMVQKMVMYLPHESRNDQRPLIEKPMDMSTAPSPLHQRISVNMEGIQRASEEIGGIELQQLQQLQQQMQMKGQQQKDAGSKGQPKGGAGAGNGRGAGAKDAKMAMLQPTPHQLQQLQQLQQQMQMKGQQQKDASGKGQPKGGAGAGNGGGAGAKDPKMAMPQPTPHQLQQLQQQMKGMKLPPQLMGMGSNMPFPAAVPDPKAVRFKVPEDVEFGDSGSEFDDEFDDLFDEDFEDDGFDDEDFEDDGFDDGPKMMAKPMALPIKGNGNNGGKKDSGAKQNHGGGDGNGKNGGGAQPPQNGKGGGNQPDQAKKGGGAGGPPAGVGGPMMGGMPQQQQPSMMMRPPNMMGGAGFPGMGQMGGAGGPPAGVGGPMMGGMPQQQQPGMMMRPPNMMGGAGFPGMSQMGGGHMGGMPMGHPHMGGSGMQQGGGSAAIHGMPAGAMMPGAGFYPGGGMPSGSEMMPAAGNPMAQQQYLSMMQQQQQPQMMNGHGHHGHGSAGYPPTGYGYGRPAMPYPPCYHRRLGIEYYPHCIDYSWPCPHCIDSLPCSHCIDSCRHCNDFSWPSVLSVQDPQCACVGPRVGTARVRGMRELRACCCVRPTLACIYK